MVTGMLQLFSFDVYALLHPGATLSFLTPLVAMKYDILPDILDEPFSVFIPVGDSVVVNRVYKGCLIFWPSRFTLVDLIGLYMLDF